MTVSAGLIQLFLLDAQMICFLPDRHWKHTNQWCFAIYFLVFISFLKLCLCMCVCVCMCTWECIACVSQKSRVGSPRPGFMDGCEPFELGAGNKQGNLQGQLFFEPVIHLPNSCCRLLLSSTFICYILKMFHSFKIPRMAIRDHPLDRTNAQLFP